MFFPKLAWFKDRMIVWIRSEGHCRTYILQWCYVAEDEYKLLQGQWREAAGAVWVSTVVETKYIGGVWGGLYVRIPYTLTLPTWSPGIKYTREYDTVSMWHASHYEHYNRIEKIWALYKRKTSQMEELF